MQIARIPTIIAALALAAGIAPVSTAAAEPLQRVEPKRVCMVNDTAFPKDQIPVVVGGKTYFGCCDMCKDRLGKDTKLRTAVDPVSHKPVDKASAVIGVKPDGKVLYFENEKNFRSFGGAT